MKKLRVSSKGIDDDRWCTIAVSSDEEWVNLCREMDRPEYIEDPRFETLGNRKKNEEELNKLISDWTVTLTPEEVMTLLQATGVPAGVVKNTADMYNDPQFRKRNIYWPMHHSEIGLFTHLGHSFQLSKTPARAYSPSPLLGEHTKYVCTNLLGMSNEEFVNLMQEGVFE